MTCVLSSLLWHEQPVGHQLFLGLPLARLWTESDHDLSSFVCFQLNKFLRPVSVSAVYSMRGTEPAFCYIPQPRVCDVYINAVQVVLPENLWVPFSILSSDILHLDYIVT